MIRLMIADDHAIVREGLKQIMALDDAIVVVAEAGNGAETLDRLREGGIDLLLLDLTMPGISGEDLVARICAHYPALPILILTMHNQPQIALRALKAGASGYLAKDRDPQTLLGAIRKVAAGGHFLDPQIAEQMAFNAAGISEQSGHQCLTDRELQVLRLIAYGHSINEIAAQLVVSNKTVSSHKARMMEKMGFTLTADVVRYALANSLIE